MKVTIVGTGDLAKGLGNIFHAYAPTDDSIWELRATEPVPDYDPGPFLVHGSIPIIDLDVALHTSDVLLLAIPAWALKEFLKEKLASINPAAILVDCTNSNKKGEDVVGALRELDMDSITLWVKGFNDTGAISLLQHKVSSKKKPVTEVCGRDKEAVETVVKFAEAHGFATTVVQSECYEAIAMHQSEYGKEWVQSGAILFVLFCLTWIYAICRVSETRVYVPSVSCFNLLLTYWLFRYHLLSVQLRKGLSLVSPPPPGHKQGHLLDGAVGLCPGAASRCSCPSSQADSRSVCEDPSSHSLGTRPSQAARPSLALVSRHTHHYELDVRKSPLDLFLLRDYFLSQTFHFLPCNHFFVAFWAPFTTESFLLTTGT